MIYYMFSALLFVIGTSVAAVQLASSIILPKDEWKCFRAIADGKTDECIIYRKVNPEEVKTE